ncbi:response regulator transcription factor [Corynebacterium sputi]|uniref:response regulator transcription factor n=1 Tax=Corynebacterium sputi TaxID=489915 RepID=UPI0003F6948A|nr:response regulator transcription factor [Corynebacterium sputi]
MTSHKILVVDDELSIVDLLSVSLRFQGFDVRTAADGREALTAALDFSPDVIILDVMMPYADGFTVLERLRGSGSDAPVLFLTARGDVSDRVRGLTAGGDDYVTKPFSLEEVIARVNVLLRRGPVLDDAPTSTIEFGPIELDEDAHEVFSNGTLVDLSPTEFSLLRYLLVNQGVVLSKAKILDHVWNYDFGGDGNVVETYVSYLRRKLGEPADGYLQTVRGVGYVLREPQ